MNREDIIRMAREAGLHRQQHNLASNPVQYRFSYDGYEENLEHFAALVRAAALEEAAGVCDNSASHCHDDGLLQLVLKSNAAAIRARSQQ